METINPLQNPKLANELAEKAMAEPDAKVQEVETLKAAALPSGEVELLAGHYNPFTGDLYMSAQVRELNGADEEAISKLSNIGSVLLTILSRAVVSIGGEKATSEMLEELLSGDRDLLLLHIRKITFGSTVPVYGSCTYCGSEDQEIVVDLDNDVKIVKLNDPVSDREFVIDCKVGPVEVVFPTGKLQKKMIQNSNKTAAELDTMLLRDCIQSINGVPVMNDSQILNLGLMDRRKILSELIEKNPGPELSDIRKPCGACSKEVIISLSLADLFRS
jgi:hypothetical protein